MGSSRGTKRRFSRRASASGVVLAVGGVLAFGFAVQAPAGAAAVGVTIEDIQFAPPSVTITAGDTVTWSDAGFASHSVTADDGSFDSSPGCPTACLTNGQTFSRQFDAPGTFAYHCKIHGGNGGVGMSGVVIVQAQATTTTTAAPTTTATTAIATTAPATTTTRPPAAGTAPVTVRPAFTG